MVETSSRVPSRPPALGWHTHGESANPTLALDMCECQRATDAARFGRSGNASDGATGMASHSWREPSHISVG